MREGTLKGQLWLKAGSGAALLGIGEAHPVEPKDPAAPAYEVRLLEAAPLRPPELPPPRLTLKVRQRYAERYTDASDETIAAAIRDGLLISAHLVDRLTQRNWARPTPPELQTYILCPQRTGIFVVSDRNSAITYLHLLPEQTEYARKHYPQPPSQADALPPALPESKERP